MFSGFKLPRPRTRIGLNAPHQIPTMPTWLLCCTAQWRIGYVAPHKDHNANMVIMLHRTMAYQPVSHYEMTYHNAE